MHSSAEGAPNWFNKIGQIFKSKLNNGALSLGFPGGTVVKNQPANVGDVGLIPGSGRSPGGGPGNPLQCSCLENPMDRCTWWATVHGVTKNWT